MNYLLLQNNQVIVLCKSVIVNMLSMDSHKSTHICIYNDNFTTREQGTDKTREPWPQMIYLYQPLEVEQILVPDNANCLAVQAFLKMCEIKFQVEPRINAEYMSPTGKVPFIKCGEILKSEFENIVSFFDSKGISLSSNADEMVKLDIRAFMSLVNNVFGNAELYICWVDEDTYENVTKTRYGSLYPWPLNHILNWQKRREVIKRLTALGWYSKSLDVICKEVEECCCVLSAKLDNKEYFSGQSTPNELDALVFGHIFTIVTTILPGNKLANIVSHYPNLTNFCKRIECRYFQRSEE